MSKTSTAKATPAVKSADKPLRSTKPANKQGM